MRKLLIATAGALLAACISTVALAEEKKVPSILPKIDISVVSDSEYNVTQETAATEFGVVAGLKGLELSLLPTWSWDDAEVSNIEMALGYTYNVNDSFAITPYAEINANKNLNFGDKIIGVKTSYKF